MTRYDAILFAVSVLGTFNALLVSALWWAPGRRSILPEFWPYPAVTALSGIAMLLIGGDHSGVTPRLSGLEWVLTALIGPLMLDAVRRGVGLPGLRWTYLVAPLAFTAAIVLSGATGWPEIWIVLAVQWSFTVLAAMTLWRAKGLQPARRAAAYLVGAFLFLHLSQALRMALPDLFRDLVPLALSLAFLVLTAVLLFRSRALGDWFRTLDRRDGAEPAIARLRQWLVESHAYRAPELRLADAAAAIRVAPADLSKWLNDRGQPFTRIVTEARLEDAARKLVDPEEARTSIEAIGLLTGFRSRSGFYKAFRQEFGITPAEYRRRQTG